MEQLAGLDAAFLSLDAKNAPMHVGGVHLYAPPDGGFGFAEFRAHVAANLDGSPIFRRRVVHVPLRLARPFWVEDPHFDLDAHLQHSALPAPGWKRPTAPTCSAGSRRRTRWPSRIWRRSRRANGSSSA